MFGESLIYCIGCFHSRCCYLGGGGGASFLFGKKTDGILDLPSGMGSWRTNRPEATGFEQVEEAFPIPSRSCSEKSGNITSIQELMQVTAHVEVQVIHVMRYRLLTRTCAQR